MSIFTNTGAKGLPKSLEVARKDIDNKFEEVDGRVAENVAKAAGDNPTKAEFDALIDALVDAGLMSESEWYKWVLQRLIWWEEGKRLYKIK